MGIYVFSTDYLRRVLLEDAASSATDHDFGRNVIPAAVRHARAFCHRFGSASGAAGDGYWRDVGTLDAYWRTNMELLGESPPLDLSDPGWPIRSYREQLPPARFVRCSAKQPGTAQDSLVADGCVIRGGVVDRSVLFPGVHVNAGSAVSEAVVLPRAHVGEGCRLRRVVVASGCRIPDGTVIGEDSTADRSRYHVSQGGIVLVGTESAAPKAVARLEEHTGCYDADERVPGLARA
jgi:glucose-1-phosphate adenylyltransferase